MEHAKTQHYRVLPLIFLSFVLLAGGLYSTQAKASSSSTTPLAGQQLAYYIGYHSAPSYVYQEPRPRYHHHHPRRSYWTGWRYVGHNCRKNCLIDRWNGRVLRCNRVCHR